MEWATLLSYIQKGENSSTKFLSRVESEDSLGPLITALANAEGGKIFIGIDVSNFHLIGTSIDKCWIDEVTRWCKPDIYIKTDFIARNDKNILCLTIPEGTTKPYFFKRESFSLDNTNPNISLLKNDNIVMPESYEIVEQLPHEEQNKIASIVEEHVRGNNIETQKIKNKVTTEFETIINEKAEIQIETEPSTDEQRLEITETNNKSTNKEQEQEPNLNQRQINALDFLVKEGSIKNKQYRELFSVSHKTAHIELVDMVTKGYFVIHGSGRSTCYKYNPSKERQPSLL
jgi:predicted HTH transcriptional regulator